MSRAVADVLAAYAATAERWHDPRDDLRDDLRADLRADARAASPVFDENER